MAQAATHPTAAVLGSPANSLGSPLSWLLTAPQRHPKKSISTPKPQRKRHCRLRFLILRQLSPSGLGRTRSRLARTASANRFVRASLHSFAATTPTLAQGCFTFAQFHIISSLQAEKNKKNGKKKKSKPTFNNNTPSHK